MPRAQASVGDGVIAPQDGEGVEVGYEGGPIGPFGPGTKEGRCRDSSGNVGDERGEAEREEFEPFGEGDFLGLVGKDDMKFDEAGVDRGAELEDKKKR